MLADDDFVQTLNRQYRNADKPTNVLAFATEEEARAGRPWLMGDVVVANAAKTLPYKDQTAAKKVRESSRNRSPTDKSAPPRGERATRRRLLGPGPTDRDRARGG